MLAPSEGARLLTPAVGEPLTLAAVKAHLRVDIDDDDDLISGLIQAARQYIEDRCWIAMLTQTWVLGLETWPDKPLRLPRTPLLTVPTISQVRYKNNSGVAQVLASSVYTVLATGEWTLDYAQSWPIDFRHWSIEIEYSVGYGTSGTSVPAPMLAALKLMLGHLYENREAVMAGAGLSAMILPLAVDSLLALYEVR